MYPVIAEIARTHGTKKDITVECTESNDSPRRFKYFIFELLHPKKLILFDSMKTL